MADITEQAIVTKAANTTEQAIVQNEQYSVREFSPNAWGGMVGDNIGFLWGASGDMLPPWGTLECDLALRLMHYTQHNSLVAGATQLSIEKFLSIPFEISGGRNQTFQWQDLFFESEFGGGYDELVAPGLLDYFTLNRGWFMELVSYGDPDTPIKEGARILGINHLDALRISFTGNREFPYLYLSEWGGKLHKMHYTRVIHIARQPSSNTRMYGMGKSSLYDALTVVNAQILLGRHQNEMLDDLPPTGIIIFNNVKADEVKAAMEQFQLERINDGQRVYRAPLQLSSKDPNLPATVSFVPMSTVPEGYDREKYMAVDVNLTALAYGLDPQDLWPLAAAHMGSGMQSNILEAKTSSKGTGYLLTRVERKINTVMPRPLKLQYKAPNAYEDVQAATSAQLWTTTLNGSTFMTANEKRGVAASQIPAFADELLDESGQVRLYESDPVEPQQIIVAADATQLDTPAPANTDTTANSQAAPPAPAAPVAVKKDIDATTDEFIQELQSIMQDGIDRTITKAGCAARIRGAINRYGKAAYQDGLIAGCLESSDLDEDDTRIIADLAVRDSQYISNLVNEIYSDAGMSLTAESRAQMWMGTTDEFYYAGIESADKNGMYIFTGDDGDHTCDTCAKLKGQQHRMKWWVEHALRPGIDHDSFDCGGWRCQHYLQRVGGC